MSFSLSTARLGIQRARVESGAHVDCCSGDLVAIVPPLTLSWYQRGETSVEFPGLATPCMTQSASVPPRLTYCAGAISVCPSVQRSFPFLAGTLAGASVQLGAFTWVGADRVESAGLLQSTWNFQTRTTRFPEGPPISDMRFGR